MGAVEKRCDNCAHAGVRVHAAPCNECSVAGGSHSKWQAPPTAWKTVTGASLQDKPITTVICPSLTSNEPSTESDGSTAAYYELPPEAKELQDIIAFLDCNAQMGEIGRAWMRYGRCPHSPKKRDIKKIIFYAQAELARLEKYEEPNEC